jgi:hypothetical protein
MPARRFPPPWSGEETDCFIVRDHNGQAAKLRTKDEARLGGCELLSLFHALSAAVVIDVLPADHIWPEVLSSD